MVFNLLFNCLKYKNPVEGFWTLNFEVQSLNTSSPKKSEVAYIVQSLKFKDRSSKSEVWCSKSGRGPKSEVGVWRLKSVRSLSEVCHKSKNCPRSVWSGLHDGDPHWSAVLLILITYIKLYFLSLFGYICMFVFVVWQINCPSLWVRGLTSVLTMYDNEGYNPTSEVCPKATIRSLKTNV